MYARLTEPLRVLRLERARKANKAIDDLGLSRTELAAALGVCRQRLAFVLRGKDGLPAENEGLSGRPPQVTAQGLAKALGLRADAFMEKSK